jgi:type III pantothenate kinase
MLLLDVGNTNIKIYQNGTIESFKADKSFDFPKERFYYICVNNDLASILKNLDQAIDLEPKIDLRSSYKGLGVDRKAVCKAVEDGVIVDAGSAITVDVMRDGVHKGGFITLGLEAFRKSFATISPNLEFTLNEKIDLLVLPNSTKDALNFATFGSICALIEQVREDLPLIFCGGDGKRLMSQFEDATFREDLVFEGMKRVIGC